MIVIARHLLWQLGVAAGAVAVLSLFGMPFSSALPIGVMAGCRDRFTDDPGRVLAHAGHHTHGGPWT